VLGNAEVLAATSQGDATAQELNEIRDNAARAVGIIRNLLVFTEANSLHRRWHNLNDLVTAAVDSRRSELSSAGVRISLDGTPRLPLVYVDGRQVERVITTLLDRWTKEPRTAAAMVTVTTQRRPTDDRLLVTINDPSTSLSDDDPTWSGDLDACRRVLETHGGALEIERLASGGFGCRLELPVTAAGSSTP
jgi:K+-sensing histidine kinase KdpD